MARAKVKSKWTSGNLVFQEETAGNDNFIQFGLDGSGLDVKFMGGTASSYMLWDESVDRLTFLNSVSSQTTENRSIDLTLTTDSTFLTGGNITYSGGRGSAMIKLTGTYSGATGGFHAIYSLITMSGTVATDGNGVIGTKGVVVNTAALTDGEVYGAQFIAKHNHSTNNMTAQASLIGLEAWAYISDDGYAATVLGANLGIHNECEGTYPAGSVLRGVQIFCDNNAAANTPVESTGLCIWNQAGSWDNAINVVNSGNGYTNFVLFTDDGAPAQSSSSGVANVGTKGWIKIKIGSSVRYIALGDGVS